MLLLVQGCILLKVMKHMPIMYAPITKKTFKYEFFFCDSVLCYLARRMLAFQEDTYSLAIMIPHAKVLFSSFNVSFDFPNNC